MDFLIKKFVESILDDNVDRTIEDVPARFRERVQLVLDEHYKRLEEQNTKLEGAD
ncbi:hypothetical protein [Listeria booriae]|uniref:hypothetical protein n=1 Tax=Listeria booriae TaxID=1552123 RepID=UPI001628F371|nr:hypothetical protein [Listeria booriae]MBC2174723.1 hypothetical protein [Listeria booriae]